jgi:hypothetical protein
VSKVFVPEDSLRTVMTTVIDGTRLFPFLKHRLRERPAHNLAKQSTQYDQEMDEIKQMMLAAQRVVPRPESLANLNPAASGL